MEQHAESSMAGIQPNTYIVNLSSLHTLHLATLKSFLLQGAQHPALRSFLYLCQTYSVSRLSSIGAMLCCHCAFFQRLPHVMWIIQKFSENMALINAYKTNQGYPVNGIFLKITTDVFLEQMLSIFDFLKTAQFTQADLTRVYEKREMLYSLKEFSNAPKEEFLTIAGKDSIAKALLEEAFNAIIEYTDQDTKKWQRLFSSIEPGAMVYLISNTTEINILAFLQGLLQAGHISTMPDTLIASPNEKGLPVVHIPHTNVFLCLSFNFASFKDDALNGTPGIIHSLLACHEPEHTVVISQFPEDLHCAEQAGVPSDNRVAAGVFYASSAPLLHLKRQ